MGKSDMRVLLVGVGQNEKERLKQIYPFAEFVEVETRFGAFSELNVFGEHPYLKIFFNDSNKGFTDRNAFCILQKELFSCVQEGIPMEGFMGNIFFVGSSEYDQCVNRNVLNGTFFVQTPEKALEKMGPDDMACLNNSYYRKEALAAIVKTAKDGDMRGKSKMTKWVLKILRLQAVFFTRKINSFLSLLRR